MPGIHPRGTPVSIQRWAPGKLIADPGRARMTRHTERPPSLQHRSSLPSFHGTQSGEGSGHTIAFPSPSTRCDAWDFALFLLMVCGELEPRQSYRSLGKALRKRSHAVILSDSVSRAAEVIHNPTSALQGLAIRVLNSSLKAGRFRTPLIASRVLLGKASANALLTFNLPLDASKSISRRARRTTSS